MKIQPICFYLPQFHPVRVNDVNWGPGFNEWSNVVKAKPHFEGHFQPKYPGTLSFYDLRATEVLNEQASLAREFGIYGFCIYYYRFGRKRLLDIPINNLLAQPNTDIAFCLCWANE